MLRIGAPAVKCTAPWSFERIAGVEADVGLPVTSGLVVNRSSVWASLTTRRPALRIVALQNEIFLGMFEVPARPLS